MYKDETYSYGCITSGSLSAACLLRACSCSCFDRVPCAGVFILRQNVLRVWNDNPKQHPEAFIDIPLPQV